MEATSCDVAAYESFEDYADLDEELLRGIYAYGLERPSAVQQRLLPLLGGGNAIVRAASGTGKSIALAIVVLHRVTPSRWGCQALVLSTGREQAQQAWKTIVALGEFTGVDSRCCIGGTSVADDICGLRRGPQIVVGTLGRISDMIAKRHLRVQHVKKLALDDADELLDQNGTFDIKKALPRKLQVCCFSATFSQDALLRAHRLASTTQQGCALEINLGSDLPALRHFYVSVEREAWKLDTLCDLYETFVQTQIMVFVNSMRKADFVVDVMTKRDLAPSVFHSYLDQKERDLVLREFRQGASRLMVSTDLLERGIDVQQVRLVLNFDVPGERPEGQGGAGSQAAEAVAEKYLHRAGRASRFGRQGVVISFVTEDSMPLLKDVERILDIHIEEMPMEIDDIVRALSCFEPSLA